MVVLLAQNYVRKATQFEKGPLQKSKGAINQTAGRNRPAPKYF
jgi:hypothetical protein